MSDEKNQPVDKEIATVTGPTRRSFLQKGAVASVPLVLTAFSRPVLAVKCSISGMQSGATSREDSDDICTMGFSPGFWKNAKDHNKWPSVGPQPSDSFGSYFLDATDDVYDVELNVALQYSSAENTAAPSIIAHLTAALLNVYLFANFSDFGPYVLSEQNVLDLFTNAKAEHFSKDAVTKVRDFLDSTWPEDGYDGDIVVEYEGYPWDNIPDDGYYNVDGDHVDKYTPYDPFNP